MCNGSGQSGSGQSFLEEEFFNFFASRNGCNISVSCFQMYMPRQATAGAPKMKAVPRSIGFCFDWWSANICFNSGRRSLACRVVWIGRVAIRTNIIYNKDSKFITL